ncbi:glycosyltransferase family 41 protein (tetratricopeptide) [Colletotrichum truncatum]|uniref:Glycosyltransferase family 41 protein (Tetratricopeptide) n=1 Tax=Colletotrichum truncatum TaxID=5467 RepID=A0ACC3YM93_COLTU|nr:glycosyltransferase family 41 protein (tetratricopeptide) [Colletotrichum truncatum]KAF6791641.1 glycosyltransferase family 41 protein (tetratricopeptide) [Colletotrichum truncatum]
MLPLVQTHHTVQQPPNFEPVPDFQRQQNHLQLQQDSQPFPTTHAYTSHHCMGSLPSDSASNLFVDGKTPRTFPIRNSHPTPPLQRRAATTAGLLQVVDQPEHQLRRKTPNGTIDAGYDGSTAHLASGPPPLKQMILPAAPTAYTANRLQSATALNRHSRLIPGTQGRSSLSVVYDRITENNNTTSLAYNPWVHGLELSHQSLPSASSLGSQVLDPSQHRFNTPNISSLFDSAAQSRPRSASFHINPFFPGGLPADGAAAALVPGLLQSAHPWYPAPQPGPSYVGPPSYHTPSPSTYDYRLSHFPNQTNRPSAHFTPPDTYSHHAYGTGYLHPAPFNLEALTLEPNQAGGNISSTTGTSPSNFREKVLAQAHRSYVDLLAYLHHGRKTQQLRPGSALSTTSRMVVYPKPPKQPAAANSSVSYYSGDMATAASMQLKANSSGDVFLGSSTNRMQMPPQSIVWDGTPPDVRGSVFPIVSSASSLFSNQSRRSSPFMNAKGSLELLTHFCEQSGWKWIDGVLLGGCLHYGLEHFEDALEWFNRVITLDPNHVEALSNMAATLYCLNRQEEAETCWLKAIRTRPQYLEAVEHLVGLLYRKKSFDAVEVISFVQKSLKMPKGRLGTVSSGSAPAVLLSSTSYDNTIQPGFGSSGYAIPGSENGRILALVHAKGTMLYSLKDVAGASEAFEEAVLISTGRQTSSIQALVQQIQTVLCPDLGLGKASGPAVPARPLLLPPEKARCTAKLVFSGNGELPGLRFVPEGGPKRAAVQTTSNSLLSLAKIFQDAMSSGSASARLVRKPAGVGDILALYYLSLSLQESPSTANNVGILLASVQQSATAMSPGTLSSQPNVPGIPPGSGLALALSYYNYGLLLDPKHVHLHTNLGSLLKDIGQLDLAIQMYEQAVQCDGNFDIALTNLANAVKDRGRINDAIIYYKRAVKSNPEFAEAVCGLSTALNSVCDWRGRGGALIQQGRFDRWHVDDDGMLVDARIQGRGTGLTKKVTDIVARQLEDASTWGIGALQENEIAHLASQLQLVDSQEVQTSVTFASLLRTWSKCPWEGSRILRLVERATRASMRKWYCDRHIRGIRTFLKYERPRLPSNLTVPSAPTVLPFHTFTCPLTAKDIRMISQRNAFRISCSTLRSPWLPSTVYPPPCPPSPHLNVGYVSSDFNNHPLAHLMQSVFGFHNRGRVKAVCYATTASDKSIHRLQIEREAPVFRDASTWSSDKLVEQIVQDGIHILVNLNGYTRGARNEIFAARPSPIQMSFMGFAGTLGAEWCDYLLADTTAIPPDTLRPWRGNLSIHDVFKDMTEEDAGDWVYSENIIFCRDTFFCCDHAQSSEPDEHKVSWEDEQRRRWTMRKELFPNLSDDTIILGNFNQLYKIDPTTFRTWLRILAHAPRAILWLLRFPELGETNLRRTAKAWAGEEVASRIIFTDVAPKNQHISRARVCDLFLDTPECNAHTTAADVLWSSTPLLTLPRYPHKMCSRMAASILKGALPKNNQGSEAAKYLIASSEEEYEEFAIRLANGLSYQISRGGYGEGTGRLATLRKLLWDSKWTCALFNTRRWVADLERAYEEAWRRWVAGEDGDIYL